MAKRKISRREEAAYVILDHQTRGREKGFEWWRYKDSSLRWEDIGYNRSKCTSNDLYLGWREMQTIETHFPEHLPLVQKLNENAHLVVDALHEVNKLREELINKMTAECSDIARCHLEYDLLSDEDEAFIKDLKANPEKVSALKNKGHELAKQIGVLPNNRASQAIRKSLKEELETISNQLKMIGEKVCLE